MSALYRGSREITRLYRADRPVESLYRGSRKVYSRWHPASIDYFARLTAEGDSDYLPFRPAIDRLMRELVNINYYDALENGFLYLWAGTGWQGRSVTVHPGSPAPTFYVFNAGDHNVLTGIKGRPDGGTYVDSNHNNNANGQNDQAMGVWVAFADLQIGGEAVIGTGTNQTGTTGIYRSGGGGVMQARHRSTTLDGFSAPEDGFIAMSRSNAESFQFRVGETTENRSRTSQAPLNLNIAVFARMTGETTINIPSGARISIAFTGPAVDLEALKSIFSTYKEDVAALG